ncbi:MAG: glycosyl hydrolase family 98 [Fibrobacter sp.]|nr:glycosyl hydrolase family 98 [Fibrobacter sp.]
MTKIRTLLKNAIHPVAIISLLFSLGIPLLIAFLGNSQLAGAENKALIGKLDLNLAFWLFSIQGMLTVILLIDLREDAKSYLKELNPGKNWWLVFLTFTAIAVFATSFWIEGRHRVQSDESIMLSAAQNLYHNKIAGSCDEGEFVQGKLNCTAHANNFKAFGLSYIYALGMPIFGKDLQWIFAFHIILFALSALVFFWALLAWSQNKLLALVGTVALMFQPTVMFQFRSSSVEPLYVFLSALSLLVMHWAWTKDTVRHWTLLAIVLAFFGQTRQETVFCLAAFIIPAVYKQLSKKDLRFPAFISTLSIFSIPILLTISYYQGYGFQGGEFEAHGHFFKHIAVNWKVMTQSPLQANGLLTNPFLTSSTWLALGGLIALIIQAIRKDKFALKIFGFLLLYHIQSYMVFENVSGDFTIEINQRYALVIFPTIAFLSAYLLNWLIFTLIPLISNYKPSLQKEGITLTLALACSIVIAGLTLNHQESFKANIMYNRNHLATEEYQILQWLKTQPQKDRLFIYSRPWHFIGYGHSAMHYNAINRMSAGELQNLLDKYQNEVYYVRGLDCWDRETWHKKAVERRIGSVCDQFENKFEHQMIFSTLITNNYRLNIARMGNVRDFNVEKLLQINSFTLDSAHSKLLLEYEIAELNSGKPWRKLVYINDQLISNLPFSTGFFTKYFDYDSLKAGYNNAKVSILDTLKNQVIVTKSIRSFFPLQSQITKLTDLSPKIQQQSWGKLMKNRSVNGNILTVNGQSFENGLGTHAQSYIEYELLGQYQKFSVLVGQDDEDLGGDGMKFRILGDNKLIWEQIVKGDQIIPAEISVEGINVLQLQVDSLQNKNFDHANWLEPLLFR